MAQTILVSAISIARATASSVVIARSGRHRPLEIGRGHRAAREIERLLEKDDRGTRSAADLPTKMVGRRGEAGTSSGWPRSMARVATTSSAIDTPP